MNFKLPRTAFIDGQYANSPIARFRRKRQIARLAKDPAAQKRVEAFLAKRPEFKGTRPL